MIPATVLALPARFVVTPFHTAAQKLCYSTVRRTLTMLSNSSARILIYALALSNTAQSTRRCLCAVCQVDAVETHAVVPPLVVQRVKLEWRH
jgi:hypothetical protein